jgi:hypothetical protein
MAITTYATLQTAIAAWLHRDDLSALVPDFITLAETTMNGDIDARSMEARTTLTASAGSNLVTLPTDMLEMRRLTLMTSDPVRVLEYKTPEQLVADNPWLAAQAEPDSFTVIAGSIELNSTPDSAYSLELIYRQKIPALSVSNTTNWLLTANPNCYLFGSLLQAAPYIQDDARLPVWQKMYADAVDTVNSIDWYSGSGLRVRAR